MHGKNLPIVILLCLTPDNFTHQGTAFGSQRVIIIGLTVYQPIVQYLPISSPVCRVIVSVHSLEIHVNSSHCTVSVFCVAGSLLKLCRLVYSMWENDSFPDKLYNK